MDIALAVYFSYQKMHFWQNQAISNIERNTVLTIMVVTYMNFKWNASLNIMEAKYLCIVKSVYSSLERNALFGHSENKSNVKRNIGFAIMGGA